MAASLWVRRTFATILIGTNAVGPFACSEGTPAAVSDSVPSDVRFATVEQLLSEFNRLCAGGSVRCRDLAPLIYAETDFQREWVAFLELVARAEQLHDAAMERFGETLDPHADIRMNLRFGRLTLISEQDQRAVAAVEGSSETKQIHLVHADSRWWVSGYSWEYAMSDELQRELPTRSLTYRVEAEIGPSLVSRIQANEFGSMGELRSAYGSSLRLYFETHPSIYEQITGKSLPQP